MNLSDVFEACAVSLPNIGDEGLPYMQDTIPRPPEKVTTAHLKVEKGIHQYDLAAECAMLHFTADEDTYRDLGLLILSVLIHPDPVEVQLELTHPGSEIRTIRIQFEHQTTDEGEPVYESHRVPRSIFYFPDEAHPHPFEEWVNHDLSWKLPCITMDDPTGTEPELGVILDVCTTISGFGTTAGMINFAELLLDLSQPENTCREVTLENALGRWGVSAGSCEVKLWLPGSHGYEL